MRPHYPVLGALVAAATLSRPAGADEPRWPRWPTEVATVAAPLHATGAPEPDRRQRADALTALRQFATPVIVPELLHALEDKDTQIQADALALCWERTVAECLPAAANQWTSAASSGVRLSALKVLSLDPAPSRLAILLAALKDPDPTIRAGAASFLAVAPLEGDSRARARTALLAKLADTEAGVRREAARSLGVLGAGTGTLALARLLEDPEPGVRAAAALALGRHEDPRAIPALIRAAQTPGEPEVIQGAIEALTRLSGEKVDEALLALLDDPPRGIAADRVAAALGRRPDPSEALVVGLIDRLAEPSLRQPVLDVLLHLGHGAREPLARAREAGLAPVVDMEVGRLLAALEPVPAPPATAPDPGGWRRAMDSGPLDVRLEAARSLALAGAVTMADVAAAVRRGGDRLEELGPWLVAAELADLPPSADALVRSRLVGLARAVGTPVAVRCLALARVARQREGRSTLLATVGDPDDRVRACTARLLRDRRWEPELEALLRDPSPEVRASAALAVVGAPRLRDDLVAPLRLIAAADPTVAVRRAARLALTTPGPVPVVLIQRRRRPGDPEGRFLGLERPDGQPLDMPALRADTLLFALAPGPATLRADIALEAPLQARAFSF